MAEYFPTTENAQYIASLAYGRYDDMRMAWVGRPVTPRAFNITDVNQQVAAVCEDRVWISLQNVGANDIWLEFGGGNVALVNTCMRLRSGDTLILDRTMPWRERIYAICGAGLTSILCVNDVWQSDVRSGRGA
jgi:hypothetical protein